MITAKGTLTATDILWEITNQLMNVASPDPIKDLQVTKWDWEACMTLPENQWGYHKDWSFELCKESSRSAGKNRPCCIHGWKYGSKFRSTS